MITIHGKFTDIDGVKDFIVEEKRIAALRSMIDAPIETYEGCVLGRIVDVDVEKLEWSGIIYTEATDVVFIPKNNDPIDQIDHIVIG